tara:strand:+ start:474 stop:1028 length:555 start_codon:yes stop_codon:yes gene_type:complete
MEKRLSIKCDNYFKDFKYNIKNFIDASDICLSEENYHKLIQYIFDYDTIDITKNDFTKRKRVKNVVPFHERCCALRANGQQCTRRKKNSEKFCGTHIKGIPHGEITNDNQSTKKIVKREIWAQDIGGIIYYIDNETNVYDHNDIINNSMNPKVIAKYEKTTTTTINKDKVYEQDMYSIPSLFKK